MKLTLSNLSDLINNEKYKAIAEEYKALAERLRNEVLLTYLNGDIEEQDINFKRVAVKQLELVLELKKKLSNIDNPVAQNLIEHIQKNALDVYEKKIKTALVADYPIYFTETDIKIRLANTIEEIFMWADTEIEKLKKPNKEDNVMEKIKES